MNTNVTAHLYLAQQIPKSLHPAHLLVALWWQRRKTTTHNYLYSDRLLLELPGLSEGCCWATNTQIPAKKETSVFINVLTYVRVKRLSVDSYKILWAKQRCDSWTRKVTNGLATDRPGYLKHKFSAQDISRTTFLVLAWALNTEPCSWLEIFKTNLTSFP